MGYRHDLWEIAASNHGVVRVAEAEDAGVPAVEMRKLAARGVLRTYGQGVYTHRDVPVTHRTEPAVAVALAGPGAFLQRESVLDLLRVGQFNPRQVRVGTRRRVRRALPDWMVLERRADVSDDDLTDVEGVHATTIRRTLEDLQVRIAPDRWDALVATLVRRELLRPDEIPEFKEHTRA